MSETIYKFSLNLLNKEKLSVKREKSTLSFGKHWHGYYEIIFYRNYRGTSILNGVSYPITENCLFMLTPKDFHSLELERLPDGEYYMFSFSEPIISDAIFGRITRGPVYIRDVSVWLGSLIHRLYEVYKSELPQRKELLYHLFNSLLMEILEEGSSLSHTAADIHPMIRESISVMLTNPGGDYSLAYFSQKLNVSTTYFSRLFHEHAGISFKQYLTTLRVEYAKRLLEERQLPVIDVGSECGFHSPSQFIRAFKQITGMTPSAYRNENNGAVTEA